VIEVVGRDAFLEVLGDPELRMCILEKGPNTIDEALRTAMSLEALDKSKETQKKVWRSYDDPLEDEPRKKKESSRLAVKSVEASTEDATSPELPEVSVTKLQEALASCMQEVAGLWKELAAMNQFNQGMLLCTGHTKRVIRRATINQLQAARIQVLSDRSQQVDAEAQGPGSQVLCISCCCC